MGVVLEGKCKKCDFIYEFLFGGNKMNYLKVCLVPSINLLTNELCSINFYEHQNDDNYLFYSNSKLKAKEYDSDFLNSFSIKLNKVNNYCPNCKNFTFDFKEIMFTD